MISAVADKLDGNASEQAGRRDESQARGQSCHEELSERTTYQRLKEVDLPPAAHGCPRSLSHVLWDLLRFGSSLLWLCHYCRLDTVTFFLVHLYLGRSDPSEG